MIRVRNDSQHTTVSLAHRYPTLFRLGMLVIVTRYSKRIKEDRHCIFERYSVLAPVGLRFCRIPLKVVLQSRFHMRAA